MRCAARPSLTLPDSPPDLKLPADRQRERCDTRHDTEDDMNNHLTAYFAGPAATRRHHRAGTTERSPDTSKVDHLNEEFFDDFAAGPRSARR